MSRLKGSKNKRKRRDSFTAALYKVLPPTTITILLKLAQRSNIALPRVLDDAVLEGATELETEAYESLIAFNERRGKVVHEREPERVHQESLDSTPGENDDTGPSDERFSDASLGPGLEPENQPDSGMVEAIEPEPRERGEIPF